MSIEKESITTDMRNKKELLEYYTDKMTGLDEVLQSRKAKVKYIITAEILLFVVAVAWYICVDMYQWQCSFRLSVSHWLRLWA